MIDEKTVNSVNKIINVLSNTSSVITTSLLGVSIKNMLCKPNVTITDFVVAAAILGLDFKFCTFIYESKNEAIEENIKLLKKSGGNYEN